VAEWDSQRPSLWSCFQKPEFYKFLPKIIASFNFPLFNKIYSCKFFCWESTLELQNIPISFCSKWIIWLSGEASWIKKRPFWWQMSSKNKQTKIPKKLFVDILLNPKLWFICEYVLLKKIILQKCYYLYTFSFFIWWTKNSSFFQKENLFLMKFLSFFDSKFSDSGSSDWLSSSSF